MKNSKSNYPVCLKVRGQKYYLLWQAEVGALDKFVLFERSRQFMLSRSYDMLAVLARKNKLKIFSETPTLFDVDKLFKSADGLRSGVKILKKDCKILLDGWNMLEDMERSCRIRFTDKKFFASAKLDKSYKKLFWGTDILRPQKEAAYHPVFSASEILLMKKFYKKIWDEIQSRTHQFY